MSQKIVIINKYTKSSLDLQIYFRVTKLIKIIIIKLRARETLFNPLNDLSDDFFLSFHMKKILNQKLFKFVQFRF